MNAFILLEEQYFTVARQIVLQMVLDKFVQIFHKIFDISGDFPQIFVRLVVNEDTYGSFRCAKWHLWEKLCKLNAIRCLSCPSSLQAVRAVTMVDGLPRAASLAPLIQDFSKTLNSNELAVFFRSTYGFDLCCVSRRPLAMHSVLRFFVSPEVILVKISWNSSFYSSFFRLFCYTECVLSYEWVLLITSNCFGMIQRLYESCSGNLVDG